MRIWFKIFDDSTHLLKDTVVDDQRSDVNRTRKVLDSVTECCHRFDLPEPIWLKSNIEDFRVHSKTRFLQDNFVESVPFQYLEIHVIDED